MNHQPDASIDEVLNALRTAEVPTGLEHRVSARLAQAAEARARTSARTTTPSFFAVILNAGKDPRSVFARTTRYALAAASLAILAALSLFPLHAHHPVSAPSQINSSIIPLHQSARNPTATTSSEGVGLRSRRNSPANNPPLAADRISRPASAPLPTAPSTDPDTIALAETLAPSHPAPRMPLTPQERFLVLATRPGQPLEIAELEPLRHPALRAAAEAHERIGLERFAHSLLGPLATSESLNPTSQDPPPPATASNPSAATSNLN